MKFRKLREGAGEEDKEQMVVKPMLEVNEEEKEEFVRVIKDQKARQQEKPSVDWWFSTS